MQVRSASFSSRNGPRFLLEKVGADAAHSSKERRRKEGRKVVLSSKNSAPTTASLPSNGGNNGVKLTDRHLPWATRAVCNPRPPVSYVVLVSDRLPPPPTPLYCIGSLTGGKDHCPPPPLFRSRPPSFGFIALQGRGVLEREGGALSPRHIFGFSSPLRAPRSKKKAEFGALKRNGTRGKASKGLILDIKKRLLTVIYVQI